jgi:DNA-binding GntR family transcriptional regulator
VPLIGPIEITTKKDRVAEAIRQAISDGKLQPGDRIVEMQLAKDLGVGNTPVREALFDLESKGFVTRIANKGTFVTRLTVEDFEHIFDARGEMEGLAVELAQKRATTADLDLLQESVDGMRKAVFAWNLQDFFRFDIEFHTTIWRLSGNRFLANALGPMVFPLFAFFNMKCPSDFRSDLSIGIEHHARVVEALRDRKGARSAMKVVIDYSRRKELQMLFFGGPGIAPASKSRQRRTSGRSPGSRDPLVNV